MQHIGQMGTLLKYLLLHRVCRARSLSSTKTLGLWRFNHFRRMQGPSKLDSFGSQHYDMPSECLLGLNQSRGSAARRMAAGLGLRGSGSFVAASEANTKAPSSV